MEIREFFNELILKYDYRDDFGSVGQEHLKKAEIYFKYITPLNLEIKTGGGKGTVTHTPWVGFLDIDETDSPTRGIYLVYLLSKDKEFLNLSIGQGITDVEKKYGRGNSSQVILKEDAEKLRLKLEEVGIVTPNQQMQLQSNGTRQKAYVAGSISSLIYSCENLPEEKVLKNDLKKMFEIYSQSIRAKRELLLQSPGVIRSPGGIERKSPPINEPQFKPKNSDEYRVLIKGGFQTKKRDHEKLVRWFGEFAESRGFLVSTPHPEDLVLKRDGKDFLIEAKMVRNNDARNAVRGALGQLYDYQYFLYKLSEKTQPCLLALFSENIGAAYVKFLDSLDIGSIWLDSGEWKFSPLAQKALSMNESEKSTESFKQTSVIVDT